MVDFAKFIKKLLIDKNIQQGHFGAMLGMSRSMTSHYLKRDDYKINADMICIADKLGYDVEITFVDRKTKERMSCN